jgi:competence protein ComGC
MSQYPQPPYGQQPQAPPPPPGYPPQYGQPPQYGYPPQGGYMPPGGYAPGGMAVPTGPTKTSGLAIAALCTALLLPAIGGLLGIILGILGIKDASKPGKSGRGLAIAGLIIGILNLVGILGMSILLPTLARVKAQANEIKTASNMRQTATAIQMYLSANRDKYPDSIEQLIAGGYVQREQTLCVDTEQPFIYLKPVLPPRSSTVQSPGTLVILYNPKGRLDTGVVVVGYADGHVEGYRDAEADRIMARLQSGNTRPF